MTNVMTERKNAMTEINSLIVNIINGGFQKCRTCHHNRQRRPFLRRHGVSISWDTEFEECPRCLNLLVDSPENTFASLVKVAKMMCGSLDSYIYIDGESYESRHSQREEIIESMNALMPAEETDDTRIIKRVISDLKQEDDEDQQEEEKKLERENAEKERIKNLSWEEYAEELTEAENRPKLNTFGDLLRAARKAEKNNG